MSDEVVVPYSLPLDSDGFLRRECPTCEREFKCLVTTDDTEVTSAPEGGYFCPYCAIQAPPTAWWTKPQLELVQGIGMAEVVGPAIEEFGESIRDIARRSGGLLEARGGDYRAPKRPDPLTETDDMRRVDFPCHGDDPVKVAEDWTREVHCLICGQSTPV
jgi:hypothetical protein